VAPDGDARARIRPATLDELEIITKEMPEPYQVMILLASWCAMRFGELTELRRMGIDTREEVIRHSPGRGGPGEDSNSRHQSPTPASAMSRSRPIYAPLSKNT
jgi:hypothetical protein